MGQNLHYMIHFMTNFKLHLPEATKFFSYFWLQLVRMNIVKNRAKDFNYDFTFWDIGLYYIFVSLEICTKYRKPFITFFLRNRGHGFDQRLFPQMYTAFKGITPKVFWVRPRTLYVYEESSRKAYTFLWVL